MLKKRKKEGKKLAEREGGVWLTIRQFKKKELLPFWAQGSSKVKGIKTRRQGEKMREKK